MPVHASSNNTLFAERPLDEPTRPDSTYVRAVRLPSVAGMVPDNRFACKYTILESMPTAIVSDKNSMQAEDTSTQPASQAQRTTYCRAVRLPSVEGMLPMRRLPGRYKNLRRDRITPTIFHMHAGDG
jgi:hypothetical protein